MKDEQVGQALNEKDKLLNEISHELVGTRERLDTIKDNLEGRGGMNRSVLSGIGFPANDPLFSRIEQTLNKSQVLNRSMNQSFMGEPPRADGQPFDLDAAM